MKIKKSERGSHWFQYGTDSDYQKWCRKQPSACSGITRNIIYAHYRTAANSGVGFKPPYSGIPLTWDEHAAQHQHGHTVIAPRDWWQEKVSWHLTEWAKSKGMPAL